MGMKKIMISLLVIILLCGLSTSAFARGGHYRYSNGSYSWWGLGGFLSGLAVGSYVTTLPPRYETVQVGGVPYYYYDGYYYQSGPSGYMVVAPPAIQGQTVVQEQGNAMGSNGMVYVLGTLFGILVIAGIGLILKKLFAK